MKALRTAGIGPQDRVAIVLPAGADLAAAFLAVTAGAVAAPLNPAYGQADFHFYLRDLPAKALIVQQGSPSAARAAAAELGVGVIELAACSEGGGRFVLGDDAPCSAVAPQLDFPAPEEIALLLYTSGTTGRPKRVPLTQGNLCASARHIAATLQLQSADISLAAMPLFHIHGLVAAVLAALAAGGSCVCPGAFAAARFLDWLEIWRPTWFSAVPTMHQAILDFTADRRVPPHSLRLIRSSSAALPPSVLASLEKTFGIPVIEAYGMTEAAHQVASNPLPPLSRKPGSVGLPAGPELAILDAAGASLGRGGVGEVAIRGPNVTRGYESGAEAGVRAHGDGGWLRTGDQGYLDDDGYLFLTGRLKELINRGGEKIVPREIDEALLAHPAVRQAVAFAVPHPSLGEDLAAAVVLRPGAAVGEAELRAFLLDRLPAFKVPSRIILVADVPKGPTGKVQRLGLAELLAPALQIAYEPAESEMETLVAATIAEVLCLERVGRQSKPLRSHRNNGLFPLYPDSGR